MKSLTTITSPLFIWGLLIFILGLWLIATLVLNYHWKKYAIPESKIAFMRYVYLVGSSFFLVVLFLATLTFSLS